MDAKEKSRIGELIALLREGINLMPYGTQEANWATRAQAPIRAIRQAEAMADIHNLGGQGDLAECSNDR